ncbi:hypothetical protein MK805_16725 [Shimazuella sp. AN120528]|uniref:hypothetical protein n=1 Tax=Shimazuella soli TaxID=1892854 RepID=UPI001F104E9C|nr:hypothetical protein [Shimazuella soli]MCH5586585.1 hypothetical protein [Shimazuella soli]
MRRKMEAIVENKTFFLWSFRTSAGLVFLSVFPILFVLVDVCCGSLSERFHYISDNYVMVQIAWSLTFAALFAICFVFTMLFFHLNRTYRPILQMAWFISVVALCASTLYLLIEILLMPTLMEWLMTIPAESAHQTLTVWDQSLSHLSGIFIPTSLSIGGLIYTIVMFQTKEIPLVFSYWSFFIWSAVLIGSLFASHLGVFVFLLLSVMLLLYVPWIWKVGTVLKKS